MMRRRAFSSNPDGALSHTENTGRVRRGDLTGGGPDGNEQLTALTGMTLIALLAVIGVTILRIRQLISVHLFVGLLLLGPIALKLGSTGYRFVRYYTRDPAYRRRGKPLLALRAIAPFLVVSTLAVFVTGVLLLLDGARSRGRFLELHKISFFVWLAFAGFHVLAHAPRLTSLLRAAQVRRHAPEPGATHWTAGGLGRWLALGGVVAGGAVLAVVLIPDFASWTASNALRRHPH